MRLSIVIVSWNTREVLSACLASLESELERLAPDSVETFVVDNASSDGSPEHIRRRFAWVKLVENDENVGFATANNRAIVESSGEFVLLLNPDTKVMDGAISSLIEFMSSTPDAGAAGSHLLNPDGTLQISSWPAPTLSRELWRLLHLDSVRSYAEYPASTWTVDAPQPVDSVQGASMILRRKALEDVGLLDAQYFMYTEEIDLCLRIRNAGWRVYWVPRSRVVHYGGQSTQQVASEMFLQLYRSKIVYFRKHQGSLAARAYKAVIFVTALARLSLTPLLAFRNDAAAQRYRSLAGNYAQLIRNIGAY